jgi:hypothetical protein
MRWRTSRGVVLVALLIGAGTGFAADPQQAPDQGLDDELLEFLGSVDQSSDAGQPDDGSWIDYLSQTDIGKVVKPTDPAKTNPGNPPESAAKSSESASGVSKE